MIAIPIVCLWEDLTNIIEMHRISTYHSHLPCNTVMFMFLDYSSRWFHSYFCIFTLFLLGKWSKLLQHVNLRLPPPQPPTPPRNCAALSRVEGLIIHITLNFPWTTKLYSPGKPCLPSTTLPSRKSWHCLKWCKQRPTTRRWRRAKNKSLAPKKWARLG